MKTVSALLATLVLIALGTSCTFVMQPKAGAGRVIIGAQAAHKGNAVPASLGASPKSVSRALQNAVTRNLSASNDISSISYTLWDLSGATPTQVDSGVVDLSYLSLEFFLTPGNSYRLVIDVALKAAFAGTKVGVKSYGDQADFTVDPYWDTYVNLTVHPTQTLVFDPSSVVSGATSTVSVFDPTTGTRSATPTPLFSGAMSPSPSDKFFYGPDSRLYYFNKNSNAVYWWTTTTSPMTGSNLVLAGATALGNNVSIAAVCADPTTADALWLVGQDTGNNEWYCYNVSSVSSSPSVWVSPAITTDLESGLTGPTVVPTGIAVDSTYNDVYVTYTATDNTTLRSAVAQFYFWSSTVGVVTYPDSAGYTVSGSTSSVFTDVVWDQGKVWALASPNTSVPGATPNTGTADVLQFDDWLKPLIAFTAGSVAYNGSIPTPSTGTTALVLPNRIAGPVQSRSFSGTPHPVLYFTQQNFYTGGTSVLSELNLDGPTVLSY